VPRVLRFYAVVCCHHKDRDVGDVGTACADCRKGGVARCIDKGDFFILTITHALNLVGSDVLGDATGFFGDGIGFANVVEKRRFTVIDVAHYHNNRRAFYNFGFSCHRCGGPYVAWIEGV
jgi:hypothetical protein